MTAPTNNRLAAAMKALFETLDPDLRRYVNPPVKGRVVGADEDLFQVDVEVDDVPPAGEEPGDPWLLPKVPVSSISGGDGFGVYAMPDIGAEVNVSFRDGDITQPRIDGTEFLSNRTPIGGRLGSFTLCDKTGQRVTLRPDTAELVFRSYNVDDETAGARNERTGGNKNVEVQGDVSEQIGGRVARTVAGDVHETVEGETHRIAGGGDYQEHSDYSEEMGSSSKFYRHARIVRGSERIKIAGRQDYQVGGDRNLKVLGSDMQAVGGSRSVLVGGRLQMFAAGVAPDGGTPSPEDLVSVEIGGPGFCCWGGKFIPGVSQAMINGDNLRMAITLWAQAVSAIDGSLAAPTQSLVAALWAGASVPAISWPASVLSTRFYLASPV